MNKINPIAMFRMTVLGPLISRDKLEPGELNKILTELSSKTYDIPNSKNKYISKRTIERWYYNWRKNNIDGLNPKQRSDNQKTKIPIEVQTHILQLKKDNKSRSLNTIISMLERQGIVGKNALSRSSVYRFLRNNNLASRSCSGAETIERRAFVAEHANDIWHADVMHGPKIQTKNGLRKVYLVSMIDDASRLLAHSAFCFSETALDIEKVFKQAVLKRGLPKKLIVDNGSAYRAGSLQDICALLGVRLIYCRPYEAQGKAKLERFHRTFREQFLAEIQIESIADIGDLNDRLWSWLATVYHERNHIGLENMSPLKRWRKDLVNVRQLGNLAEKIDEIFYHRHDRYVRKDGTIRWAGRYYEVPFELSTQTVNLVVDPHNEDKPIRVESIKTGEDLGTVVPLNLIANNHRRRTRPRLTDVGTRKSPNAINSVDLALRDYTDKCKI